MNSVIKIKNPLVLLLGLAVSTAGHAQAANVGITLGTTGTNIEISKPANDYVSVRADMYVAGSLSKNVTLEGNSFAATYTPDTKSLLVDIRPFKGAFYFTGGLVQQNINFKLTGTPSNASYTFNETEYDVGEIGSFTGTAGFDKSTVPYLGLGWSNRAKKSEGVAFSFEAGVIDVGAGKVDISVSCGSGLSPSECSTLQDNVASETDGINSDLNRKLYYPVVKLGLSYRF